MTANGPPIRRFFKKDIMSFQDTLNKHNDHTVVIIPRLHKNKFDPVPGLYCQDCAKLIKWLSDEQAEDLVQCGVEQLSMLKDEQAVWDRRQRIKLISAEDLGL